MHLLHRITVCTTSPSNQISYLSLSQFQRLHSTMAESISEVSSPTFQDVKTEGEENKTENQKLLVADDGLYVKKNEGI